MNLIWSSETILRVDRARALIVNPRRRPPIGIFRQVHLDGVAILRAGVSLSIYLSSLSFESMKSYQRAGFLGFCVRSGRPSAALATFLHSFIHSFIHSWIHSVIIYTIVVLILSGVFGDDES